jgi:hypothetical protein
MRTRAYTTGLDFPRGLIAARPQRNQNVSGRIVISACCRSVTTMPVNCLPARGGWLGRQS